MNLSRECKFGKFYQQNISAIFLSNFSFTEYEISVYHHVDCDNFLFMVFNKAAFLALMHKVTLHVVQ